MHNEKQLVAFGLLYLFNSAADKCFNLADGGSKC